MEPTYRYVMYITNVTDVMPVQSLRHVVLGVIGQQPTLLFKYEDVLSLTEWGVLEGDYCIKLHCWGWYVKALPSLLAYNEWSELLYHYHSIKH